MIFWRICFELYGYIWFHSQKDSGPDIRKYQKCPQTRFNDNKMPTFPPGYVVQSIKVEANIYFVGKFVDLNIHITITSCFHPCPNFVGQIWS